MDMQHLHRPCHARSPHIHGAGHIRNSMHFACANRNIAFRHPAAVRHSRQVTPLPVKPRSGCRIGTDAIRKTNIIHPGFGRIATALAAIPCQKTNPAPRRSRRVNYRMSLCQRGLADTGIAGKLIWISTTTVSCQNHRRICCPSRQLDHIIPIPKGTVWISAQTGHASTTNPVTTH